jgi:hypothetical protein
MKDTHTSNDQLHINILDVRFDCSMATYCSCFQISGNPSGPVGLSMPAKDTTPHLIRTPLYSNNTLRRSLFFLSNHLKHRYTFWRRHSLNATIISPQKIQCSFIVTQPCLCKKERGDILVLFEVILVGAEAVQWGECLERPNSIVKSVLTQGSH